MIFDSIRLAISGCYSLSFPIFSDDRGSFYKLFHESALGAYLPGFLPREIYLTTSTQGVLRGMHFQIPPNDHSKVVICLSGRVNDVLLDLRPGIEFGKVASVELSPEGYNAILIPKGVAHGFYAHENNSSLLYLVETVHSPDNDRGVLWNSFEYDWPNDTPILSERDQNHPALNQFDPPLEWGNYNKF